MQLQSPVQFPLSPEGFVPCYLTSGPALAPYTPPVTDQRWDDQIAYEVHLRSQFHQDMPAPENDIRLGQNSPLGMPWRYAMARGRFINENAFFHSLTAVQLMAVTCLISDRDQDVDAWLWTYMAADVYVNGERVCQHTVPVYKPIARIACILPLRKGRNLVTLALQNLGVRDTRNMAALQLMDAQGVTASLPDETANDLVCADAWLGEARVSGGNLNIPHDPPFEAAVAIAGMDHPVAQAGRIGPNGEESVALHITVQGQTLTRALDVPANITPRVLPLPSDGNAAMAYCRRVAAMHTEVRGTGMQYAPFHVLARRYAGTPHINDLALLRQDLAQINKRVDCSDFLVTGLLRLVRTYPMDAAFLQDMKGTLLNWRYWMDEEGADGMCFWSENHALMFHAAQMMAGAMYPDDVFTRSGRTGRQQHEKGLARVRAWLHDTRANGMEEFNSAGYLPVTAAALLNVVDFGPADVSESASALLDSIFRQLCRHVFDRSSISPQGRVYRDVITPHRQAIQDLLHWMFPDFPAASGSNVWNVCYATSKYRLPDDLRGITEAEYTGDYLSGHARVRLTKTKAYALTSVDCPRDATDAPEWVNQCFVEGADRNTNTWTRSINERFHGTSVFEPGVYGYQQHLWYAALTSSCVVFVTLPGNDRDNGGMRPDYWYGNGVFPALRQSGASLGLIYEIPDNYPIGFTHAYWPSFAFDRMEHKGNWLFGRAGQGAVALWCSGQLTPHDDQLTACEYRCRDKQVAWYCVCAACPDDAAFEAFMAAQSANPPQYAKDKHTLTLSDGNTIVYEARENKTQFI